jgi:hypothetical protein
MSAVPVQAAALRRNVGGVIGTERAVTGTTAAGVVGVLR